MIHSCFFCLVIVVHESLVCPEQLNWLLFFRKKILQIPQTLWCSRFFFLYLNPFQQWLYDFEIHLFTLRTTEGLICNYYRRFKHSLMLQKEKRCIKSQGVKTFEQNGEISYIFSFSTALQRLQKIVFPEEKISKIYPDLQIQKVFSPQLLMTSTIYIYIYTHTSVCVCVCVFYIPLHTFIYWLITFPLWIVSSKLVSTLNQWKQNTVCWMLQHLSPHFNDQCASIVTIHVH